MRSAEPRHALFTMVTQMAISDAGCDVFVFGTGAAASELSEVKPDAADTWN